MLGRNYIKNFCYLLYTVETLRRVIDNDQYVFSTTGEIC